MATDTCASFQQHSPVSASRLSRIVLQASVSSCFPSQRVAAHPSLFALHLRPPPRRLCYLATITFSTICLTCSPRSLRADLTALCRG